MLFPVLKKKVLLTGIKTNTINAAVKVWLFRSECLQVKSMKKNAFGPSMKEEFQESLEQQALASLVCQSIRHHQLSRQSLNNVITSLSVTQDGKKKTAPVGNISITSIKV